MTATLVTPTPMPTEKFSLPFQKAKRNWFIKQVVIEEKLTFEICQLALCAEQNFKAAIKQPLLV